MGIFRSSRPTHNLHTSPHADIRPSFHPPPLHKYHSIRVNNNNNPNNLHVGIPKSLIRDILDNYRLRVRYDPQFEDS